MILSVLWVLLAAISLLSALFYGAGAALSAAATDGAQKALEIAVSMAGALCLWTGLAKVMESSGISRGICKLSRPFLGRIFPKSSRDGVTFGYISANFTANLLGLGNAATPMGIAAVRRMKDGSAATDEMCRLIVLNTASIQLLPTTVAALRAGLGAARPFDILPAVWITSLLSASAGVLAARCMEKHRG